MLLTDQPQRIHSLRHCILFVLATMSVSSAAAQTADKSDARLTENKAASSPPPSSTLQTTSSTSTGQNPTNLEQVTVIADDESAEQSQIEASNTASILSEKDLQRTAVHNIAEALGLMPSVNVIKTGQSFFGGIDGAARGEGMFASVRGLNAEYNVNLINGVNVAQGMPYSRSVQLSLLPPSGLQTIVLNKTSTAAMDGDAIGGTIDYQTPTAFNYTEKQGGSLSLSGRLESRARDYGNDGLGKGVAANYHGRYGDKGQLGFSITGYYDEREFVNSQFSGASAAESDRTWTFNHTQGSKIVAPGYDPEQSLLSTGTYVGLSQGQTRRFGGNLSLDWRVNPDLLVYLHGTYARALTTQNTSNSELIPTDIAYVANPTQAGGFYQPRLNQYAARYWYETNPEVAELSTIQFGLNKRAGMWTISPNLFFSTGQNDRPDHIEISARSDQYFDQTKQGHFSYGLPQMFYPNSSGYPVARLTPALRASLSNVDGMYVRRGGQLTKEYSGQHKGGFKVDTRREFDQSAMQYLQFGMKYSRSSRSFTDRDWTNGYYGGMAKMADIGLINRHYASAYPGLYDWPTVGLNNDALKRLIADRLTPKSFDTCNSNPIDNLNCNTMRGTEAVAAAYVMASFKFNQLEMLPGLRYESTAIHNTFWHLLPKQNNVETTGYFDSNQTHYHKPLPSLFFNWRPSGDFSVYRAGVWTSYTRPAFVQLGGGAKTSQSDGKTVIKEGNPNLKAIDSVNFDLSGEWSNNQGRYAMLGAYYKRLSHYLYESGSNQANPITNDINPAITYVIPENGSSGHVAGIEAAFRQRFNGLPALLNGLGVGGNVTLQSTRVDLGKDGFRHEPIQNVPKQLANASLFYEHGPLNIDLSWHFAGEFISVYNDLSQQGDWSSLWVKPSRRVDLSIDYALSPSWHADLSISNLTNKDRYWAHIGHHSTELSDIVDAGMTGLLTLKHTF